MTQITGAYTEAAARASDLLPFVYPDQRVGTGNGPNVRKVGRSLWEARIALPFRFRVSFWGGWIDPAGQFYPNLAANSDDYTLRLAGLEPKPSLRWSDLQSWAVWLGWVRVGYWQNAGGTLVSPNPYTMRRVIFSYVPEKLNAPAERRIIAVAEYFEDLFHGGRGPFWFLLESVEVSGVEAADGVVSISSNQVRSNNSRLMRQYIQMIKRGSA